jgi:ubiquinol-cytochrome c reductase cytochrome c subunit
MSGYLVIVMALGVLAGVYALLAPRTEAVEAADTSTAVEEGRQLFLQSCSSCHGLNAQGGSQGPSLIGVGSAGVQFQVGTGRMPLARPQAQAKRKPPSFTREQIDQLAAYVASLAPGPTIPALNLDEADLAEGGELFRLNCAQCHNFVGSGGALSNGKYAPDLSPATAEEIAAAMRTGPEAMPVFGPSQLTDQEVNDITAYVQYIEDNRSEGGNDLGAYGPITEGLAAWVIGITALVAVTIWIGGRA